ncbi:MAG: hypothetical protein ABWK04_04620 [Hydrogenobacter sp.]
MSLQWIVFLAFLISSTVIASVYLYVALSSFKEKILKNSEKFRFFFFLLLSITVAIYLILTLPKAPYFAFSQSPPDRVLHVVAKQFSFAISGFPITDEETFSRSLGNEVKVKKGEVVEFRVTSFDVNHGFGIYDPEGRLIAQVQAMPGYINRLRYRFKKVGIYTIQCLEYCGIAHAYMNAKMEVVP